MTQLQTPFEAADHAGGGEFEPLPVGDYQLMFTTAKTNSTGGGVVCEFDVVNPAEFQGRKLWFNINIFHAKTDVREMGMRDLGNMALACGVPRINNDVNELAGRVCVASVRLQKNDPTRNDIARFIMPEAAAPAAPAAPTAAEAAAASAAAAAAPAAEQAAGGFPAAPATPATPPAGSAPWG